MSYFCPEQGQLTPLEAFLRARHAGDGEWVECSYDAWACGKCCSFCLPEVYILFKRCAYEVEPGQEFEVEVKVKPKLPWHTMCPLNLVVKDHNCQKLWESGFDKHWDRPFRLRFRAPDREGLYKLYFEVWLRCPWDYCAARAVVLVGVGRKPTPPEAELVWLVPVAAAAAVGLTLAAVEIGREKR